MALYCEIQCRMFTSIAQRRHVRLSAYRGCASFSHLSHEQVIWWYPSGPPRLQGSSSFLRAGNLPWGVGTNLCFMPILSCLCFIFKFVACLPAQRRHVRLSAYRVCASFSSYLDRDSSQLNFTSMLHGLIPEKACVHGSADRSTDILEAGAGLQKDTSTTTPREAECIS